MVDTEQLATLKGSVPENLQCIWEAMTDLVAMADVMDMSLIQENYDPLTEPYYYYLVNEIEGENFLEALSAVEIAVLEWQEKYQW